MWSSPFPESALRIVALLTLTACVEGSGSTPSPETESIASEESVAHRATPPPPDLTRDSLLIAVAPSTLREGSIFRILLDPVGVSPDRIEGSFSGEALHFHRGDEGRYESLAATPVGTAGEAVLRIEAAWQGADPLVIERSLTILQGDYRMERLTVAPEFGDPYPPATQRRIDEESARAMGVSRASHSTPRMWSPPFLHPRDDRITSGFGHGRSFNGQVQSRHMGTDFAGGVGAPVLAPARGIVALVGAFYLGGNVLYLDHGGGLVTAYLHLSEQTVAQGDTVAAGDLIGRVGATGRVTGPHLHWIVRYGEITVDGTSLLELY